MVNQIKKIKLTKEVKELKKELRETTTTLILAAFGMVAALAWNEAIKSLFDTYLKKGNQLISKFIYAIIVTIIVVIISRNIKKIGQEKEEQANH